MNIRLMATRSLRRLVLQTIRRPLINSLGELWRPENGVHSSSMAAVETTPRRRKQRAIKKRKTLQEHREVSKICDAEQMRRSKTIKVTLLGAAGGVGEALALLLKQSPLINRLALYDIRSTRGITADINHMDSNCEVTSYTGLGELQEALQDSSIVVVTAAPPYLSDCTPERRFARNAEVVAQLVEQSMKTCPRALMALVTSPVNSLLPVVKEESDRQHVHNNNQIFGVTTLDVVQANSCLATAIKCEPRTVDVPVVGGSSENTIVPVFSQARPCAGLPLSHVSQLTRHVQKATHFEGSCQYTMAMAFAAARFTISLCRGLLGHQGVIECAYVPSMEIPGVAYLETPLELGPTGIIRNLGVPFLSSYETCLLDKAVEALRVDIEQGVNFAHCCLCPAVANRVQ